MKYTLRTLSALSAACILLVAVFFLRIEPSVKIWENYKMIYFPVEYSNEQITGNLAPELRDLVIFSNSDYSHIWDNPLHLSRKGIEVRGFTLESMRDFFFYDRDGNCRIIYAPESVYVKVVNSLKKSGIPFGTDSVTHYPYLYPAICMIVLILLAAVSRMSFIRAVCGIPMVLFCLWCPLYQSAAGAVCLLFAFMMCEQFAGKKHGAVKLVTNPIFCASIVLSIVSVCFGGLRLLMLWTFSAASCVFLFISVMSVRKLSARKYHFQYVPILTARNERSYKRLKMVSVVTPAAAALILCVFFFMSAGIISTSGYDDLYLPSPSEYTSTKGINTAAYSELKELRIEGYPDFADFSDEYWLNTSYQYSRIMEPVTEDDIRPGDSIVFPFYKETADGIHVDEKVIARFDDGYLEELSEAFIKNGGAERFLAEQGNMFTTTYIRAGDSSHDVSSMLSIISVFILFIVLLIIKLIKGNEK